MEFKSSGINFRDHW